MKKSMSWLTVGTCLVLLGAAFAATASAGPTGEKALFRVTEPLDVGGTILQPGEYQIRIAPSMMDRNVLQVWNADETKLLTTVLTIPNPEVQTGVQIPASGYVFYPVATGQTKTLRTWFVANTPGSRGYVIVYPKQRAIELAALIKEPVVAVADTVKVAEFETAPLVVVTPDKVERPYTVAEYHPDTMAMPESAPMQPPRVAENRAGTMPMPETTPAREPKVAESTRHHQKLPQTASNLPLYAGLGFLSILAALGVGVLARRLA